MSVIEMSKSQSMKLARQIWFSPTPPVCWNVLDHIGRRPMLIYNSVGNKD